VRIAIRPIPLDCSWIQSPCGWIGLVVSERGLYEVVLGASRADLRERLCRYNNRLDTSASRAVLAASEAGLREYFHSPDCCFALPLDLHGLSEFSIRVLTSLAEVRCGEVISYGNLARRAGSPGAARAVGRVMAGNPFPIVIPCHRVLGSGGAMTGYSGGKGIATKLWLLRHEQGSVVQLPGLA
jgi:methylated-DNA-[protein]-cysteine S-methyltransferase